MATTCLFSIGQSAIKGKIFLGLLRRLVKNTLRRVV